MKRVQPTHSIQPQQHTIMRRVMNNCKYKSMKELKTMNFSSALRNGDALSLENYFA